MAVTQNLLQARPSEPLPVARELGDTSLMFLVHPKLTLDELEQTVSAIEKVLTNASK
jgi:dTDP-4-amino-4,6-dideoxygalactose transaminase